MVNCSQSQGCAFYQWQCEPRLLTHATRASIHFTAALCAKHTGFHQSKPPDHTAADLEHCFLQLILPIWNSVPAAAAIPDHGHGLQLGTPPISSGAGSRPEFDRKSKRYR